MRHHPRLGRVGRDVAVVGGPVTCGPVSLRATHLAPAAFPSDWHSGGVPYPDIRFCRLCGTATEQRVPELEDRLRAVCPACGYVDYVNPTNVVGTIPVWRGADGTEPPRILLCLRNIEPRKGYWTLPAGFLEYGEAAADGAARETLEEAGARVDIERIFAVYDVVHAGQVHFFYLARLLDLDLEPGPETIENTLVTIDEIPWDELSFRTVRAALEDWVADEADGAARVHTGAIERSRTSHP